MRRVRKKAREAGGGVGDVGQNNLNEPGDQVMRPMDQPQPPPDW